jgi:DNA-binding transcriptional ArsR family regulator
MTDALEGVWKALADSTRRRILDLLRAGPRTTGELCARFAVSRFAVMKHLAILERAGLVLVRREGRQRWNYLNAVPIRQIYERWISDYEGIWAGSLLNLKRHIEGSRRERGGTS